MKTSPKPVYGALVLCLTTAVALAQPASLPFTPEQKQAVKELMTRMKPEQMQMMQQMSPEQMEMMAKMTPEQMQQMLQ